LLWKLVVKFNFELCVLKRCFICDLWIMFSLFYSHFVEMYINKTITRYMWQLFTVTLNICVINRFLICLIDYSHLNVTLLSQCQLIQEIFEYCLDKLNYYAKKNYVLSCLHKLLFVFIFKTLHSVGPGWPCC